jgi:hypothetical protein
MRCPHRPLDRAFVRAVRTSGHNLVTLAALAGYAAHTQISGLLNARTVPITPLSVGRLHALAQVIAYTGPIFKSADVPLMTEASPALPQTGVQS